MFFIFNKVVIGERSELDVETAAMQTTLGTAAAISSQIRPRRRGGGRILLQVRRGGDLGGAGGGPAAGLELQVHGGGVPRRFRSRWRAPTGSLHGDGGAAPVRETEVRGTERKEERQGETHLH